MTKIVFFGDPDVTSDAEDIYTALMKEQNVDLYVNIGDNGYDGTNPVELLQKYFPKDSEQYKKLILILGNHDDGESESDSTEAKCGDYLPEQYQSKPEFDSTDQSWENTRWLTSRKVGDIFFIGMNSQDMDVEFKRNQFNWVEQQINTAKSLKEQKQIKWVINASHKPWFTLKSSHSPYTAVREIYSKLFEDVVNQNWHGHNHNDQAWWSMIAINQSGNAAGEQKQKLLADGKTIDHSQPHGWTTNINGHSGHEHNAFKENATSNKNVMWANDKTFSYAVAESNGDLLNTKWKGKDGNVLFEYNISDTGSILEEPCPSGQCKDPTTLQCRPIGTNETVDANGFCKTIPPVGCPSGQCKDPITLQCRLPTSDETIENGFCKKIVLPSTGKLTPISVAASGQDLGKEASKAIDGDFESRWSVNGDGAWIEFKFDKAYPITKVKLTGYHYDKTYFFEINGKKFENAAGRPINALVEYDLTDLKITSDTVRIIGHGNNVTTYNSYREIEFYTGTDPRHCPPNWHFDDTLKKCIPDLEPVITPGSNKAPIAKAGQDQTVVPKSTVTLNGLASSDPDGTISSYSWSKLSGPTVSITNANSAVATFVAPLIPADLLFQLRVTDNKGVSSTDTVKITVSDDNTTPPDDNVDAKFPELLAKQKPGLVFVLDGSQSTGNITSWNIIQDEGPTVQLVDNPKKYSKQFIMPNEKVKFTLTVSNATKSNSDTITVNPDTTLPTGDVLWDSNIHLKTGQAFKVTSTYGDQSPDGKGVFMAASGSPRLIVDADGTFHLEADAGHGRVYIKARNYNARMEGELMFEDNKIRNTTLRLRSRHNMGGDCLNRFGGFGVTVEREEQLAETSTERCHNEHSNTVKKPLAKNIEVGKWLKFKYSCWSSADKKSINQKLEYDYNDGQGFKTVLDESFSSVEPHMMNEASFAQESYAWLRINNESTGKVAYRNVRIVKI